jgi:excisionase family DNA binding protein
MRQGKHPAARRREATVNGLESLLSERQAAAYLGVARITMLRMRQAGKVKFYKIGTRVLYDPSTHLREFLAGVERNGAQETGVSDAA